MAPLADGKGASDAGAEIANRALAELCETGPRLAALLVIESTGAYAPPESARSGGESCSRDGNGNFTRKD